MSMKYKYYVVILFDDGSMKYLTGTKGSQAFWRKGEKALPLCLSTAKDIVFGLTCNGYSCGVLTLPSFMEPKNL